MGKIWIQDWGTYGEQTLVCFGSTKEEILKYLKKNKCSLIFLEAIKKEFEIPARCDGCFWYNQGAKGSILWLEKFEWTAHCMGVLAHEITHAVRRLLIEERDMYDEVEAVCYQTEYLTKNILKRATK